MAITKRVQTEEATVRVNATIPVSVSRKLEALKKREKASVSWVVGEALDEYLEKHGIS
ncbi:MAG: ribbon-helix-helix domain-containing protein [Rhizomicrobium sp.]